MRARVAEGTWSAKYALTAARADSSSPALDAASGGPAVAPPLSTAAPSCSPLTAAPPPVAETTAAAAAAAAVSGTTTGASPAAPAVAGGAASPLRPRLYVPVCPKTPNVSRMRGAWHDGKKNKSSSRAFAGMLT